MGILKNLFVEEVPDETPDIPDIDTDFDTTETNAELDSVNTDTCHCFSGRYSGYKN